MRIIAGTWRGRELLGPVGTGTRPVLDRVKGAIFDMLGSRLGLPGQLPSVSVLDLYCGTGSMGLEALSRGARHCHFVDRDRSAVKKLRQNIENLGATDCVIVSSGSATTVALATEGPYQLVFIDPPYPLSRDVTLSGTVPRLFLRLSGEKVVTDEVIMVCRHEETVILPQEMAGFARFERRRFGKMAVTFYGTIGRLDATKASI